MEVQLIVALVVVIPVILFPAAFVWYVNISGMYQMMKEKRVAREKKAEVTVTK